MKIADLKKGSFEGSIEAEIVDLEEPREVLNKYGMKMKVATARIKDDSGEIKLSLWNQDADKYKLGDRIRISNGWVSEFKGELQVSAGRNGKIEKV